MGTLYLVATPIGNLEDITLRALRILREVPLIAAEDTRTARKLLSHYNLRGRLISYNEHNKKERLPRLLEALGQGDLALVSEAGMPGIADPGYDLVVAAVQAGFAAVPVPGPSAIVAAVAVAGLPARQFTYVGFLPRRGGQRRRLLASLALSPHTIVALESPHRLQQTLADLLEVLGDRRLAVCRELTKVHEEVFRSRISEAIQRFQQPRGEFTLVIEGLPPREDEGWEEAARRDLLLLLRRGARGREAAAAVAGRYGVSRRRVYRLWLEIKSDLAD